MTNVWQELTHDSVFTSVEGALGTRLSPLLRQRNSYINRVFEIERDEGGERLIVKFYRPGRWSREQLLEEHSFLAELKGKDVPVIAPIEKDGSTLFRAAVADEIFFCLFPKKGGRAVDECDEDAWKNIGRHLARIHLAGEMRKGTKRITWRPSVATKHHLDVLLSGKLAPDNFRQSIERAAALFIARAEPLFEKEPFILIHGDCHRGNLISRPGEGIFLIDFDDMCLGPPVQDLWMLLPGDVDESRSELKWFMDGYRTFRDFDAGSMRLVPALRGMRLVHFASWLSVQSGDPHFDKHFPEARTAKYWKELVTELNEINNTL